MAMSLVFQCVASRLLANLNTISMRRFQDFHLEAVQNRSIASCMHAGCPLWAYQTQYKALARDAPFVTRMFLWSDSTRILEAAIAILRASRGLIASVTALWLQAFWLVPCLRLGYR